MKLKDSPIIPEAGEWYIINYTQTSSYDIMNNIRLGVLRCVLAPVKSVIKQGSNLLEIEFDTTKQVELAESFDDSLLKADKFAKALKKLSTAIEKRTGLIFKKDK